MPATDPSWTPVETFPDQLNTERTWLAGMLLTAVGYGVILTLFGMCFNLLLWSGRRHNTKQRIGFLVYVSIMFACATFYVAAAGKMTELSFITFRNIPDGPTAFETVMYSIPVNVFGNCAFCIAGWLGDGLMVWRCWIIYKNSRFPVWIVMFIPMLVYLATFVLGVLWLVQIVAPQASPWSAANSGINYTSPYLWTSFALNLSMTIAIVSRLMVFRNRIANALGATYGVHYTSASAVIVESSFLSSAFFLMFLVPFMLNKPIQNTFVQLLGEILVIAPLMIIYRVASGTAWTGTTASEFFTDSGVKIRPVREHISLQSNQFSNPVRSASAVTHISDNGRGHEAKTPYVFEPAENGDGLRTYDERTDGDVNPKSRTDLALAV